MALPFRDASFDSAVMALAINFAAHAQPVVDALVRVVKSAGLVSIYACDMPGGDLPTALPRAEMEALGIAPLNSPSNAASRMDALHTLGTGAGLERIRPRETVVTREFDSVEDYWATTTLGPNVGPVIAARTRDEQEQLKSRVRSRLQIAAAGRLTCTARANAIAGRKRQ